MRTGETFMCFRALRLHVKLVAEGDTADGGLLLEVVCPLTVRTMHNSYELLIITTYLSFPEVTYSEGTS